MRFPPTMEQAAERGLVADEGNGIHTFSNGTAWECWSGANCDRCAHWDANEVGPCAFEAYAFLGMVSPELARLFGWVQNPEYDRPNDHRHGWDAPEKCAFFKERSDDQGDEAITPPFVDPDQLTFIPPDGFPLVQIERRRAVEATR